jgi:hypothetical protein
MLAVFGATWFALAVFAYTWGCQWRNWFRLARIRGDVNARRLGPHAVDDVCLVLDTWETSTHARERTTEMLLFWVTNGGKQLRAIIWDRLDVLLDHAFDAHDRIVAMRCTLVLITLARYEGDETIELLLLERGMMAFMHETVLEQLEQDDASQLHLALTVMTMLATDEMKPIDIEVMVDTIDHVLREATSGDETVLICAELLNDIATTSKKCAACLTTCQNTVHYLVHEGLLHDREHVARTCIRVLITVSAQRETHAASLALVNAGVFDRLGVLFERTEWSDQVRRDTVRLMANILADGEHVPAWIDAGLAPYMRSVSDECATNADFKEDCIICASNALCGTTSVDEREHMARYGLERIAVMGLTYAPTSEVYTLCVEALVHVCQFQ